MLTKAEYIATLQREVDATKHLVAKLGIEHLAFRFTPPQRSTQELIQHLAVQIAGGTAYYIKGDWTVWEAFEQQAAGITPAAFGAQMDRQMAEVRSLLDGVSEADFASKPVRSLWGYDTTLGAELLETVVKWANAYKTQLFLQAKAAGLATLASSDLWLGRDPQPKAANG